MTDEQINIAIAESLGAAIDDNKIYMTIDGDICGFDLFTADLNACHEFEETLILDSHARLNYLQWLGWEDDYASTVFACVHATARQRCESYLRTIGKWIE